MSFVSATDVSRRYDTVTALDRFSLHVNEGEIVALVGPDGAGKTTFMRILCHLVDADSGQVHIDGMDVTKEFDRIKSLIGYMPQIFSLYPDLSVEENLSFYAGIYGYTGSRFREKRDLLYRFSQLGPFARRRAGALSGGMKQKLALSCALLHDPKLLILDEPTTGVDPLSRKYFWEMLLELRNRGVTILVSTPYMDEAARSDRTSFIFNGRRLVEGSPDQLAAQYEGSVFCLEREPSTELVESLSSVEGMHARRFGCGLQLYLDRDRQLLDYHDTFHKLGLDAAALDAVKPTLEDRFIQLMEQSL